MSGTWTKAGGWNVMEKKEIKSQVILVDAAYADRLAADLSAHFSHALDRKIPSADLAEWLVCCALDAAIPQGEGPTQVVFVCEKDQTELAHFLPSNLKTEIDGQAFNDAQMGEFLLSAIYQENLISGEPLFAQCVRSLLGADGTPSQHLTHLVLVPDMLRYGAELTDALAADEKKISTLLTMNPHEPTELRHAVVGFSLMHAMGIRSDEV